MLGKQYHNNMEHPRNVWRRWKNDTTIIGVSRIEQFRKKEEFVWGFVTLLAGFIVVFQCSNLSFRFLQFEVKTSTSLVAGHLRFPAFTICNINPYKASELAKLWQFVEILDYLNISQTGLPPEPRVLLPNESVESLSQKERYNVVVSSYCKCNVTGEQVSCVLDQQQSSVSLYACVCMMVKSIWSCVKCPTNQTCHYRHIALIEEKMNTYGFNIRDGGIANQVKAAESLPYLARTVSNEIYEQITYNFSDFVRSCRLMGKPCGASNFVERDQSSYGRCYTLDPEFQDGFAVPRRGPDYGLTLLLASSPDDYLSLTESEGFRVVIHEEGSRSFTTTTGFDIPAGLYTKFAIRAFRTLRLNQGSNVCVDGTVIPRLYTGKYTIEGCQRECAQTAIVKKCGCSDPRYPTFNANDSYCGLENNEQRNCVNDAQEAVLACDCPSPCDRLLKGLRKQANESSVLYAILEVFFDETLVETIVEADAYQFATYLSDLGATSGFWLGISVVSGFEILLLIYDLGKAMYGQLEIRLLHLRFRHLEQPVSPVFTIDEPDALPLRAVPLNRDWDPRTGRYRSEKPGLAEDRARRYRILARIQGLRLGNRHRMPNTRLPI
ncbi:unnamed protein product, partial [Mesorhabditis spiculigera]